MPFTVKKIGSGKKPWKVVRKDTGTVKSTHTSKKKAIGSMIHAMQGSKDLRPGGIIKGLMA